MRSYLAQDKYIFAFMTALLKDAVFLHYFNWTD